MAMSHEFWMSYIWDKTPGIQLYTKIGAICRSTLVVLTWIRYLHLLDIQRKSYFNYAINQIRDLGFWNLKICTEWTSTFDELSPFQIKIFSVYFVTCQIYTKTCTIYYKTKQFRLWFNDEFLILIE